MSDDECPHDDVYRWPNGNHECVDCGAIARPERMPD